MLDISKTKVITVKASGEYNVLIGEGLLGLSGELIKEVVSPNKVALITDDVVDALYSKQVCRSLEKVGFSVVKFVFPHGEKSKNLNTYGQILSFLAKNKLTRTDLVVALGGGVVGDMAGFAASTYLRGIKYVQIPTTLLSQIDSSVGGKTAVDLEEGKNLVGAFCQPSLVICDVIALYTLPQEIFNDGMGEASKYAILDKGVYSLISSDSFDLFKLICLCVDYKRKVVEQDEFEGGLRRLLNLGHTLAHGIEKLSNYTVSHGRAVSMGLIQILKSAFNRGLIDESTLKGALSVVEKCVGQVECEYPLEQICLSATSDKKISGDEITLIMPFGIGDCRPVKIKIDQLWGYLA